VKKAVLLLVAIVALAVTGSASAASPLAGWWPLYEGSGTTAHDTSGNHNNGILSGAAKWTQGYFGSGLAFDGTSAKVDVPDTSSLEPNSTITVTAYVKSTGSPGNYKYIIAKGATSCIASSYALYTGANGGLEFYVSQNGGLNYVLSPDAGTGVWNGQWHFVVGTDDGSAVHLYVDGKQIGTGTPVSGPIAYDLPNGNDLFFGHYDGCPGFDYSGSLDEPTVWSHALTPSQVSGAFSLLSALHGWVSRLPAFPGS